jgi:hypothetical protein
MRISVSVMCNEIKKVINDKLEEKIFNK